MSLNSAVKSVFLSQYKKIDSYRPTLSFLYFYIILDLTFTGGVLFTTLYPPIITLIFTPELIDSLPVLYDMTLFATKIISMATPFLITFFVLDKGLKVMLFLQRQEQKLVLKLLDRYFNWYYKKHKKDPKLHPILSKLLKGFAGINVWFLKRKTWQQYGIILSLFVLNNPYLLFIFFSWE